jgi:methyl-accepting chemotaxis protein
VLIQYKEIDHVACAMIKMNATVSEVARNAANAAEAAGNADEAANTGNRVLEHAINDIVNLAGEVENATQTFHALETESGNIGNVLSVIKGIAGEWLTTITTAVEK